MGGQPGRMLSATEAARQLGCHVETIRVAIRRHELLAVRDPIRPGHPFQIAPADLAAFLEKRRSA